MKKILFLTTHNFATNPRLVKEIRLAIHNNFKVEVICFEFNNWSYEFNQQLKKEFTEAGVVLHLLQAGRKPFIPWLRSVVSEKTARLLSHFLPVNQQILANAVSRRSRLLVAALKKIKNTDWVIGHNPGALWPTLVASEKLNCKAGFDVEDYHPGEGHQEHLQKLTRKLMQRVLPTMNYVSFAAPLIREAVKSDLGKEGNHWITVLNYFPAAEFIAPAKIDGPLKLVWFSQNISNGRGLEYILPVLQNFSEEMELHLFGNLDDSFYESHLKQLGNVIVHNPLPQKDLHKILSQFDVGLALELAVDKNRDLCITNKILAYLQAGLFVVASNTSAQKKYLQLYNDNGIAVDIKNEDDTESVIQKLVNNKEQFRTEKLLRFQNFDGNNWKKESVRLVENWKNI